MKKSKTRCLAFLLLVGLCLNVNAHEGHSNTKSVLACDAKALSSDCSYVMGNKLYKGSCRSIASKTLCVRSEPIEYLVVDAELLEKGKGLVKKS